MNIKCAEENEESEKVLGDEYFKDMSVDEFLEHVWKKCCGRPRPAKYNSKQESMSDKMDDSRVLDDG